MLKIVPQRASVLFPSYSHIRMKLAVKYAVGVYLAAELLLFLYLLRLVEKKTPGDLTLKQYINMNLFEITNSSIFHKFPSVDCQAIKDERYTEAYAKSLFNLKYNATDDDVAVELDDCEMYFAKRRKIRGVLNLISEKELDNPIAFSIGTHSDAVMFERLLSMIYRSHNVYCIHVDLKARFKFYLIVEKLAKCYNSHFGTNNVFLTEDRVSVYWAHWTMVQADINCMRHLLVRNTTWRWYMNLAGTELPLMTNKEMVERMTSSSEELVGSITQDPKFNYRQEYTQYLRLEKNSEYNGPSATGIKKPPLPYGLQVYKGSKNIAVSRSFVNYIANSEISRQLRLWFSDTWAPDEHFIPTLVRVSVDSHLHVLQDHSADKYRAVPGVIAPELIIRYTIFEEAAPDGWICGGRWQRWLCVFGFINLPELLVNQQNHMVANKFDPRMDPVVVQCLEQSLIEGAKKGKPFGKMLEEKKKK